MIKNIDITEEDFYQSMLEASKASIEVFAKKHRDKIFYGFSIETLAEQGYFQMAFNTEKDLEKIEEQLREDEKWNNQAWEYFDFNGEDEAWKNSWKSMQERIDLFQENYEESQFQSFRDNFIKASVRVLAELERINIFDLNKKTDYFRTEVFEHHDRW